MPPPIQIGIGIAIPLAGMGGGVFLLTITEGENTYLLTIADENENTFILTI